MASVDILSVTKQKTGSLDLEPSVFEAQVRPHLYHAEVRRQLALRRQGTHSTKNRSLVSGGGAKPYRQKGTGRARQGSKRAPQWAGGGVIFGPVPRSYEHKLPKKMRRAALVSALSEKLRDGDITVIDGFGLEEYRTRRMVEILAVLGLGDEGVLIVLEDSDPRVEASARNLEKVSVIRAEGLNVYDTLRHAKLLMTRAAIEVLQTRLGGRKGETSS